ncbi:MAG TPA: hotdog fold thioesterase [Caldithrix abyssi]|uniref:Hotdog fold thioesterase n=1 Tax=Caldithrix abyssi TaxID=187145 RepID=A0A7V4WV98_CALAY|nr:hotdog fold thioesterase [Caldithrix abyssi]
MSIWFQDFTLEDLQRISVNTMVDHLGIEFVERGPDFLKATMPVDHRTVQPAGLLHGGASVALAETLGSVGAYLCVDPDKYDCVGVEINANHLRPMRQGYVTGTARPLQLGRRIQVWEIRITDAKDQLVCVSRITIAVVEKRIKTS